MEVDLLQDVDIMKMHNVTPYDSSKTHKVEQSAPIQIDFNHSRSEHKVKKYRVKRHN